MLNTIGRTPLVRLKRLAPSGGADVFVKLEYVNPTGSYKDRMALAMIEGAEARGALRPGMRVIEYTGGSTGSSLAMVCAVKGYPFAPLSSDAFAREKIQTMEAFGAEVEIVPSDGGKVTPALFDRFKARVATLNEDPDTYWTDQFHNTDALNGYRDIGVELLAQLGSVDVFCGAVGTAGMLVGVSRALKAGGSRARIVALEPSIARVDHRSRRRPSGRGHRGRFRAAASHARRLRRGAGPSTKTRRGRWAAARERGRIFADPRAERRGAPAGSEWSRRSATVAVTPLSAGCGPPWPPSPSTLGSASTWPGLILFTETGSRLAS